MHHAPALDVADPPDPAQLPDFVRLLLMATSKWVSQCLYVVAKLGIADLLAEGPRPVEELARDTGCDPRMLRRVLRVMASFGVFAELPDRRFAPTPAGDCLRSDARPSVRNMAIWSGEEPVWRPYGEILHTVRTGQPAFEHVHGQPVFDWLDTQDEVAEVFDAAMTSFTQHSVEDIVADFDFSRFGVIADLGGGRGELLGRLLDVVPGSRGILVDRPQVIDRLGPPRADGRLDRVAGDFFTDVPPGADAYVLRTCLHDWDDEECTTILGTVRNAMQARPEARLLIIESVLSEGNGWDLGKLIDIEMMVVAGGQERTGTEWAALLGRSGLRIVGVTPTSPPLSVIEVALA